MDGPYRSTKIRGGVALPRRGLVGWQGAVGLAAATWLLVVRTLVGADGGAGLGDRLALFFGLGCLASIVIGTMATAIVTGRGEHTREALGLALAPACFAELWAAIRVAPWGRHDAAELSHVSGARLALDVATVRLGCWAITSVAAFTLAIACTGLVLGVRREAARGPIAPSVAAGVVALGFATLRLRDWHRDGFVGAIPVFGVIAAAISAPMLVGHARSLVDWHDARERRMTTHGAWAALLSIAVATLACERALLAYEEATNLRALDRFARTFDARYEAVHALVGSSRAHGIGLAIAGLAFLVILASAARDLAPRRGAWAAVTTLAVVLLAVSTEGRMRSAFVDPPGPILPAGVELPRVESAADGGAPRPSELVPLDGAEPKGPAALVIDRRVSTRRLFEATGGWSGRSLGLVATGGPPPPGLGPHLALVGPRWTTLPFDIGTLDGTSRGRDLLVLDEGGIARVRVIGGPSRGISLRRDEEERQRRLRVGHELGSISTVLVAPAPTGDIQSLANLLSATRDLTIAPVFLTRDYQTVSERMDVP